MPLEEGRYIAPRGLKIHPAGEDGPPFWELEAGQEFEFRDGYIRTQDFVVHASAGGLKGALDFGWIEPINKEEKL